MIHIAIAIRKDEERVAFERKEKMIDINRFSTSFIQRYTNKT